MSVVPGGSKCKLITCYGENEDGEVGLGRHHWLAQTFTLDEPYIVWRCLVKSYTRHAGHYYLYSIRATDEAGAPTGEDIAATGLSALGEALYSPGKWRRFDFSTSNLLEAGQYALVVANPTTVLPPPVKWRAATTYPYYHQGKAWRSDDSGETWQEVPNTDLMFQIWGWPPPVEPPPTPIVSNWAPWQLEYQILATGYVIVLHTDNSCHLFMRWTRVPPEQHKIPRFRRGVYLFDDKRFCFVAWHENEQLEPGDTYIHTFIKIGWPSCETRYFYFVGTKQAEQQPSTSPIFTKHFLKPTPDPDPSPETPPCAGNFRYLMHEHSEGEIYIFYETLADNPAKTAVYVTNSWGDIWTPFLTRGSIEAKTGEYAYRIGFLIMPSGRWVVRVWSHLFTSDNRGLSYQEKDPGGGGAGTFLCGRPMGDTIYFGGLTTVPTHHFCRVSYNNGTSWQWWKQYYTTQGAQRWRCYSPTRIMVRTDYGQIERRAADGSPETVLYSNVDTFHPLVAAAYGILMDPDDPTIIFIIDENWDLYKSTDTGDTWTRVFPFGAIDASRIYDWNFSKYDHNIVYILFQKAPSFPRVLPSRWWRGRRTLGGS